MKIPLTNNNKKKNPKEEEEDGRKKKNSSRHILFVFWYKNLDLSLSIRSTSRDFTSPPKMDETAEMPREKERDESPSRERLQAYIERE